MERVYRYQRKGKLSKHTKITAALKQLLTEDIDPDRLTDVVKLRCVTLNVNLERALPELPRRLQHNLSDYWRFRSEVQGELNKQNLVRVHNITLHDVFVSSLFGQNTKK